MELRTKSRLATLLVSAALGVSGLATPSAALADVDPSTTIDPSLATALENVEADTWTQADLDLIRSVPEVAALVPDPSEPPVVLSVAESLGSLPKGSPSAAAPVICGAWVDVWYQKTSVLGNSIYRWHHYVRYCRNGSKVTSWQNRYDYVTDTQTGVYVRELEVNQQWGIGTNSAVSHLQRHLEFCIARYGCYENHHPWSKVTVHGNGTSSFTGSTG